MVAAQSLNKSAFDALAVFCKLKLKGVFTQTDHIRVIHTSFGSQYLDLLCGWTPVTKETFKGAGSGRYIAARVDPNHQQTSASFNPFPLSDDEIPLIGAIAEAFDISEMSVSSYPTPTVRVKVLRSRVLDRGMDTKMFWQVNLSLVQPSTIPFQLRLRSYGFILPVLGSAVKWHLPSLILHNDCLLLTHMPYPTLSPITLELTSNITELFSWMGFRDPLKAINRWELGFESEPYIWKWLVGVVPGSHMAYCWEKMAKYHVWSKANPAKAEWMRRQREGRRREARDRSDADKKGSQLIKDQRFRFLESLEAQGWAEGQPYTPAFNDGELVIRPAITEANLLPIDPEHPKRLDGRAVDVLQHFGKCAEFEAFMKEKKTLAWEMAGK